jgi:hypothetical protein
MPDDRDGYPHGRDTADYGERVRSPFDRQRLRLGAGPVRRLEADRHSVQIVGVRALDLHRGDLADPQRPAA